MENVIVQLFLCVWLIQILDGGWNEGFKGSLGFYCTSFQWGEGRNGCVRSGWGQIRFWLSFHIIHMHLDSLLAPLIFCKCLSLTPGGAAGAVSRITGALGKGIATLTLDDDYQKKRRENMTKRPTDVKEGLARGGKGLVMVSVWHVEAKVLSWWVSGTWRQRSCHGECLARGGKGLVMVSVWHVEAKVLSWWVSGTWRQRSSHGECLACGGKGLVMVSVWHREANVLSWWVSGTWRQRSCHGECLARGGKGLVMVSVWHREAKVLSWWVSGTWRQRSSHGECLARGGKGLVMVSVWHVEAKV